MCVDPAVVAEARARPGDGGARARSPGQEDAGAGRVGPEGVDHGLDGALHDVVGQHDEHGLAVDEVLGQAERLGDAAGILLIGVGQLVDAVLVAVAQQAAGTRRRAVPPVTSMISSMPALTKASMDQAIIGRSQIGRRCLFVMRVSGYRREPVPPARSTPFIASVRGG